MQLPSIPELIRECGVKINTRACGCCNRWALFQVGGFTVCLMCDTTAEAREQARLEASP